MELFEVSWLLVFLTFAVMGPPNKWIDVCPEESPEAFSHNASCHKVETAPPTKNKSQVVPFRCFFCLGAIVGGGWWLFKNQTTPFPTTTLTALESHSDKKARDA